MSGRIYEDVTAGQWVYPKRKGYRMQCCDCGLVHAVDFRIVKYGKRRKIEWRMFRDNRATAAVRRKKSGN